MRCTASNPIELDRRQVRNRLIVAAVCVAAVVGGFLAAPVVNDGPAICPLRAVFGLPCPSCGITRAACAATRGQFADSVHYHIFGPVVVAGAILLIPMMLIEAARRRRLMLANRVLFSSRLGWAVAAVLIVYHAVRLTYLGMSGQLIASLGDSLVASLVRHVAQLFA